MAGAGYNGRCMNHPKKRTVNARLCNECFREQNDYLKTRVRDVETYDEDRLLFLYRKSKELDLGYTKKEIRGMVRSGMTDNLILKTGNSGVWTYGGEPSKAIEYVYE